MKSSVFGSMLVVKPLREVFWFYGVIPSSLLWATTLAVYFSGAALTTLLLMFAVLIGYTVWIISEIWLCRHNVAKQIYGDLASLLTAAWAANTLLLSGFLLLQRLS